MAQVACTECEHHVLPKHCLDAPHERPGEWKGGSLEGTGSCRPLSPRHASAPPDSSLAEAVRLGGGCCWSSAGPVLPDATAAAAATAVRDPVEADAGKPPCTPAAAAAAASGPPLVGRCGPAAAAGGGAPTMRMLSVSAADAGMVKDARPAWWCLSTSTLMCFTAPAQTQHATTHRHRQSTRSHELPGPHHTTPQKATPAAWCIGY